MSEHAAKRLMIKRTPLKRLLSAQPKKAQAIRDRLFDTEAGVMEVFELEPSGGAYK